MNPLAIDGIWLLITALIGAGWINNHRAWVKGLCSEILAALHRFELWCLYSGGLGLAVYGGTAGAIVGFFAWWLL